MRDNVQQMGDYLADAHAHLGTEEEILERLERHIPTLLCGTNPEEMNRIFAIMKETNGKDILIPTWGIHPWRAMDFSVEETGYLFDACSVVGEIGMDSVWCQVPVNHQKEVFSQQLSLAQRQEKPVILHTKGMEEEIFEILLSYPNRYLVHWYSSDYLLEQYIQLGCYISVGPDVWWNPTVQQVARRVPTDRLLLETDGMAAVNWAYDEGIRLGYCGESTTLEKSNGVKASLEQTWEITARLRGMDKAVLRMQMEANFRRFCGV